MVNVPGNVPLVICVQVVPVLVVFHMVLFEHSAYAVACALGSTTIWVAFPVAHTVIVDHPALLMLLPVKRYAVAAVPL